MRTDAVGVAVAQFAPTADKADNLRVIDELSGVAAARGAAVVLFPEYASYFVDPFDATLAANAEDLDGAFVAGLTEIAAHRGVVVVAGLVERGAAACETRWLPWTLRECGPSRASPLRRIRTARVRLGRTGTGQRSRDLRRGRSDDGAHDLLRPALSGGGRVLADAGAHVILVAAEWVRGPLKEQHWRTLLHARHENTLYVAGADHPPPLGVGASVVVDPQGVEIAGIGTATDVAVGFADAGTIDRVRRASTRLCSCGGSGSSRADQRQSAACLGDDLHPLAGGEAHQRRVVGAVFGSDEGRERNCHDTGACRQLAAELGRVIPGSISAAASATVKYEPAGVDTVNPAAFSPRRVGRVLPAAWPRCRKTASGSPSPTATASWNGVVHVGEELLDRQDGIDQVGGTGDPPDLPSRRGERLARGGDRQGALGGGRIVAIGTWAPSKTRCSYTSSVTMRASWRSASRTISARTSAEKTAPVGLCGSFTRMIRVRSVTAAARGRGRAGSRASRSGTVTSRAPASATAAAYAS
jgi:predicted amidohydrolase